MKLTGKTISIGRHDRDGEAIDGVLIEVPREQLQQGGILYRDVVVHDGPTDVGVDFVVGVLKAGDRLDLMLRCEAGIEDIEEWSSATREMQLAMIAEARRLWQKKRVGQ